VIVLDKTVSEKMIGILVDDVHSVTTYNKSDIDEGAHSSNESHRDIIGVIRKHKKDETGKEKSNLVIWLDLKTMIGRIEHQLLPHLFILGQ
jgi:purine-binding chemotaxis protein CheW